MEVGHEALGTHEMRTATKWCVPPGGVRATCLEWWRSHHARPRLLITPIRLKAPFQTHPRRSSSLIRSRPETRSFDAQWAVCCQPSCSHVPGKGHSNQLPRKSSVRRRMMNETHTGCQDQTLGLWWAGLDALSTPIRSITSAGMPDDRTPSFANSDAKKDQRCIAGQRV